MSTKAIAGTLAVTAAVAAVSDSLYDQSGVWRRSSVPEGQQVFYQTAPFPEQRHTEPSEPVPPAYLALTPYPKQQQLQSPLHHSTGRRRLAQPPFQGLTASYGGGRFTRAGRTYIISARDSAKSKQR